MTVTTASRSDVSETSQANPLSARTWRPARTARRRGAIGARAVCAALVVSLLAAGSAVAAKVTETFESTGGEQSFVVPAGVTSVHVRAIGQAGEAAISDSPFQGAASARVD
jgi:hypothetical protein